MAKKEVKEQPAVDNTVQKQKIKKKPSMKRTDTDGIIKIDLKELDAKAEEVTKVDLAKTNTNEVKEDNSNDSGVVASTEDADATQKQEEVQPEAETQETPVLEEITEEEVTVEATTEEVEEAIAEAEATGKPLPENIQKLMDFMEDTGGDLNDYVKLNKDYSEMDNLTLLKEYYKDSKPHLNDEEINFMMEDNFSYEEDVDDDKDIRRKKLALKEQVASAKSHLDGQKSKYYEEIKAGSKLTTEQQKAIDFFGRYNKKEAENTKIADKQKSSFLNKTENVFNDKFKGFEYNVGDKKFRFNVNNANEVKDAQSDINNFVKKFLNESGEVSDAKGYHKSLYTAMNADAIAKHFYEQGQTDAMQNSVANAKNIDMNPRQSHSGEINVGGMKVKVLGDNSSDFKFKIKNKNK
tara:strand:+ start:1825 stop:3048 length:1224 start_codon:yes stop_codon:yes gene_type:complete